VTAHLRLKDLGRWLSGGTPPKDDLEAWQGDIAWISAKDINGTSLREPKTFISDRAAREHSKLVDAGAIVMIVRGMALAHGLRSSSPIVALRSTRICGPWFLVRESTPATCTTPSSATAIGSPRTSTRPPTAPQG
jgi:hypothetical protein